MSLQVQILRVLSGHPKGRASISALKDDLSILAGCPDWCGRMKRFGARVPLLDIFSQQYVLREPDGWQITEAGRDFLHSIEQSQTWATAPPKIEPTDPPSAVVSLSTGHPRTPFELIGRKTRQRRHRQGATRSSA